MKPTATIKCRSATDGISPAMFTVTMSTISGRAVTVFYSTVNNTATAGSDYTANSGSLIFAAGETTKTISVEIQSDVLDEPNETFFVNLTSIAAGIISDGHGIGTITDDDPTPTLSVNDVTVTEANTLATFTISLSAASSQTVTVSYFTASGTAFPDFTATSGSVTFAPGETTKTAAVTVKDDSLDEADETFFMVLSTATNANVGDNTGIATIIDNDAAPSLSINDVTVTEGTGTATATFTVRLSTASGQSLMIDYATTDGTALAGSDYTATTGTLTFAAGSTTQTISVVVKADVLDELDETFFVNLSTATNASIADSQALATITDDDAPRAVDQGCHRHRRQLWNEDCHLHSLTVRRQQPSDQRRLRHGRQHRHRGNRLPGRLRDTDHRRRRDLENLHCHDQRRCPG